MKTITDLVSQSFIWGVGITPPKPGRERVAALFITGVLAGAVLTVAGVFVLLATRF